MNSRPKLRVGILGAGLGSRLRSRSKAKPLAMVDGASLLGHLLGRLRDCQVGPFYCALREELLSNEDRAALPPQADIHYLFVNTESSLHTLGALIQAMKPSPGTVLFSMADTVLQKRDLEGFVSFCEALEPRDCAVLLSRFVDDEKPLWAHLGPGGLVESFNSEPSGQVTSGLYLLTPEAMEIAEELIQQGVSKMRNFLSTLAERRIPIKSFVVSKTIDVDHPSDLDKAAEFLRSN